MLLFVFFFMTIQSIKYFIDFTEYDPFYVPIVYAEDNTDPTTTLEAEMEKQAEKQELENEAKKQLETNTESETQEPNFDVRFGPDENGKPTPNDNDNRVIPHNEDYLTTTTTIRPTKRRPTKQDSECELSPDPESDVDYNAGYRFGAVIDSRIEFADVPVKIRKIYDISLQFKTNKSSGVLFYAADSRHTDFIVLYLKDGYVSRLPLLSFLFCVCNINDFNCLYYFILGLSFIQLRIRICQYYINKTI